MRYAFPYLVKLSRMFLILYLKQKHALLPIKYIKISIVSFKFLGGYSFLPNREIMTDIPMTWIKVGDKEARCKFMR